MRKERNYENGREREIVKEEIEKKYANEKEKKTLLLSFI